MHFEFKTQCLDLPQCSNGKDFLALEKDTMEQIESTEASMGKDLDQIFDILNDNFFKSFGNENDNIAHDKLERKRYKM